LFLLSSSSSGSNNNNNNNNNNHITVPLTIFYLAMYNTTLNNIDIGTRIRFGIPNSLPVPLASTVFIQENGEVGDHSHDPEFYQSSIPSSQLDLVTLTIFDFDNQPVCPNYYRNLLLYPPSAKIAVFPNPSLCLLYREDGSTVDSSNPFISANNVSTRFVRLRIRPAKNKFSPVLSVSPFCFFSYYAVDGVTAELSMQAANVSIFVTQVNQPPVPVQNLTTTAIPHQPVHVYLRGYAGDNKIARWLVLSVPMYGDLYTVSKSGMVSPTPLVLSSNAIATGYSVNISTTGLVYVYTGAEDFGVLSTSDVSTGFLASDYFAFSLVDAIGHESISAFFLLSVHTAISAVSTGPKGRGSVNTLTTTPLTIQGICSPITLYANDLSNLQRNVTINILQEPSRGQLFADANCSQRSVLSDRLPGYISWPYSAGLIVYYLSDSSFFTSPNIDINGTLLNVTLDSFSFQASSTDAQSALQKQIISVGNYNHATEIQLNVSAFEPLVLGAYGAASPSLEFSVATIVGFSIFDSDLNTGLVRVRVSTLRRGGVVSLYPAALDKLDFNSAHYCLGNLRWQCTGSGFEDSMSVFVTYPSAALAALNGMTYRSTKPNIIDVINITIFDGEGGECLDNRQQSALSTRQGCFIRSVSFQVTVTGFTQTDPPVGSSFNSLDQR